MPTTHVFIVGTNTFKYHLEYLFAGTGAKENQIDFNTTTVGECYINAPLSGPMNIGIYEKGNVHYKGTPTAINLTLMSKGILILD